MPKSEIFVVPPELQQVLDNLPEDGPRLSRLEPFKPFILRWRRQGRSYRKILRILRAECHLKVAYGTLHEFVKLRSRPRKPQPNLESEPATVQPAESSSGAVSTDARKPRMSMEERIAQADALRAQFAKPVLPAKPKDTRPLFDYDPDRPLTLIKPKEK